jgi:energy-coupling factor transporter ATP-binding protein EcfA2
MEINKLYRVLVFGPAGAGKSQFCNFVQNDKKNSINEVRFSLNSCTQDPKSNIFEREGTHYDFIDTAGNGDKPDIDDKNFKKLVDYLKSVKQIDYILLLLSFGNRLTDNTKECLKKLGNIFTPNEFYNHLSIIFTNSPEISKKNSKKFQKISEKYKILKKEITEELKKTFNVENTLIDKSPEVYFIDTEIDEDTNSFSEESLYTLDAILGQLKLNADKYKSINTLNIDIKGENVKLKIKDEQKEINAFKDKIKEISLKKNKEEIFQEVEKNEENENLINEIKNKNENFIKRQEEINDKVEKYGIYVDKLDGIKANSKSNLGFIITEVAGGVVTFGGLLLTAILPEVGPIIAIAGLGMMTGGGLKKLQEP